MGLTPLLDHGTAPTRSAEGLAIEVAGLSVDALALGGAHEH